MTIGVYIIAQYTTINRNILYIMFIRQKTEYRKGTKMKRYRNIKQYL